MRARLLTFTLCAAAFLSVAAPARAQNDRVQFFSNIHVGPNDTAGNAVCFFCSVDAEGPVNGNIVAFFSHVSVHSTVDQNVVSFFSKMNVLPGSTVHQNLVTMFGSVRVENGAHVDQNAVTMFGSFYAADSASIDGNRVYFPFWFFGIPALLLGLVIYVIVRELRERRYRRQWMASQAMGPRV
jgi:hypothetical protein